MTSLQQSQLSQSCQRCWGVLNRLHDLVEKYQVIENTSDGVRKGIRRVWKRVQWDQSEVDEIHQHLSAQIDYFVLFLAGVNAHAASEMKVMTATMKTGVDRLNRDQDEIARQGILDWLTPVNYAAQQRDFFGRRKKDTGQWLLDAAEFQKWVGCPNQVLYCPGIPGAGKTILMSTVNDYLSQKYLDDGAVATAYVFCSFRRHHEQSPLQLFAGLLKQLASRCKPLPECLRQSYKKHTGDSLPGLDEIIDLLVSVLNGYKRAFFVVDALDECPVSDGSQHIFIEKLLQLQKVTESNLLTTSRPDQSISDCFKGSMFVDIRADDADVAKYLNSEMFRLPACASRNPDLQIEIKSVIIKAVQGMYAEPRHPSRR